MRDCSTFGKTMTALFVMAFTFASTHWALAGDRERRRPMPRAEHIILFIGDGMQLEHEVATSRYLFGNDSGLSFHHFPYRNSVTTWDVNTYNEYAALLGQKPYDSRRVVPTVGYDPLRGGFEPYPRQTAGIDDQYFLDDPASPPVTGPFATDSASAATAWATGHKTEDGNIAWLPGDPKDGKLTTIAELLRQERGHAIGVVSTVPFSHATPAAHVSHSTNRRKYHEIAREILTVFKPEVVIGGGHPLYDNAGHMPLALYNAMKANPGDYEFAERTPGTDGAFALIQKAQSAAGQGRRLFGLFGGPGGNFESPMPRDLPGTPHVMRATIENPLLKDATLAALKVLSQDPDGFFLLVEQGDIDWANHARDYRRMIGTMWDLHAAVETAIDFVNQEGDDIHWSNTLLIVTSDHANGYMRLNGGKPLGVGDLPTQSGAAYPDGEVTYGTGSHTNELVRIYAKGRAIDAFLTQEGRWYPCRRIIDNTQLYHIMAEVAGVPQKSPLKVNPSQLQ